MPVRLDIEIEGEKKMARRLRNVGDEATDFRGPLRETGKYLTQFFSTKVFDTEGAVYGKPWQRLSSQYANRKQKLYPGKGILEATGRMRESFEYDQRPNEVRVHNTTSYFKYHQSNQPRRKLPRRVMMDLDEKRKQGIVKIFHDNLERAANNSGLSSRGGRGGFNFQMFDLFIY